MSIPPQVIRVKRKRVEEAPLRFLQFEEQQENQRSSSIWAYQRRAGVLKPAADAFLQGQRPVIHASTSNDVASPCKKRHKESPHQESGKNVESGISNRTDGCEPWEPRRFHVARSPRSRNNSFAIRATISKRTKSTPALFIERDGKKRRCHRLKESRTMLEAATRVEIEVAMPSDVARQTAERRLKRPGVAHRIKNRDKQGKYDRKHRPLPQSLMNRQPGDMENVAADMNQWVMNEIGANLESMEREKLRQQHWQKLKFRPKAPAQRCHQSHEEPTRSSQVGDVVMTEVGDASDESDDDWIIDEYVRIPANSVATGMSRADIGILVLDEKEENMLFFGPMDDEDDYENEDEDDENAENHYTADYPEDDLESDDAYGRWPYDYRNGMISDDKEFDQVYDSGVDDADDGLPFGDAEGDEDEARMARLKASVRRHTAL